MRRPILRASPAMLRRAMEMQAPLKRPAVLPAIKRKPDQQLDLEAERKDTNPQTK